MKKTWIRVPLLAIFSTVTLTAYASPLELLSNKWVDVREVLASPSEYDGKTITIKGWASVQREDYGIWASQADYEKKNWQNCISLLNAYPDDRKNRALNRKDVLVTGVFSSDSFHSKDGQVIIRLGACNKAGIRFLGPNGLRKFGASSH